MTKVRLCFHDRCFDGTASAALFYRFYRERFDQSAEFGFTGMTHRAAQPWEAGLFDGDENVDVDRSGAGKWPTGKDYSGTGVPPTERNGEAAAGGQTSGAASRTASQID